MSSLRLPYAVDADNADSFRMDMQYASLRLLFDEKPFLAPVKNPQSILDVGTGTGNDKVSLCYSSLALTSRLP